MPVYLCTVVDRKGKKSELIRETLSEEILLRELSREDVFPLSVRETILHEGKEYGTQRIPKRSLIEFTESLSLLLSAGFTLNDALDIEKTVFRKGRVGRMIEMLRQKVRKGNSFHQSLEGFGKSIPPLYRGMVRIGEKVGSLEKSFQGLSLYLHEEQKIKEKFISAMMYPAIILGVAAAGIVIMLFFALPKIREMFAQLGAGVPPRIESMMESLDTVIIGGGVLVVLGVLCTVAFLILRNHNEETAEKLDRILLRVPVLGEIIAVRENLNLLFAMETLTSSGFSIEDALLESTGVVRNGALRAGILHARRRVMRGENLSTAFMENQVFSDRLSRWIEIGERSGSVEKAFAQLRSYYQEEVKKWSSRFINLIEPILILLVGVIIFLFIIFFIIPVFSIYGNVGL
jgi:type II secretory pathway component PulF